MLLMGCSQIMGETKPPKVVIKSKECTWVKQIRLSKTAVNVLREAQVDHPEIRRDRENIVRHNFAVQDNCK